METAEKKYYSTQEAAEQLGMSDSNLRNLIRNGKAAPTDKFGHIHMFTWDEIERLRSRSKSKGGRRPKAKVAA